MQKILCLVSVLLVGIAGVNSLQCYVCENCPDPTEADLMSCDDPVTTSAPPSTTSTSASTTPTPAPSTSTPTPATSTPTPATSTPTPATSTPTPATSTPTPATSTPTPATSTPAPTSAASILPMAFPPAVRRFKRSILSLVNTTSTACNCKNEVGCNCDNGLSRISTYADYVCFKVVLKKNDVIVRGCAPATLDSKAPCQVEDVVAAVNSCSTCDTDQCNGSYMTQFSVYMLLATVCVILFK